LAFLALPHTRAEETLQKHALDGGLGVDLVAHPGVFYRELFLELIDNTRADIAVGSYVVGEHADGYGHLYHLPSFG
jgi:hypothetical protein